MAFSVPIFCSALVLALNIKVHEAVRAVDAGAKPLAEKVVCQCRRAQSLEDCPSFEEDEDPRFYHADVEGEQLCCRVVQQGLLAKMTMQYKAQPTLDLCMKEVRPLFDQECCMLKSGIGFRVSQVSATNWATQVAEDARTWEDYTSKSQSRFKIEDITAGYHDREKMPNLDRVKAYVKNHLESTGAPPLCEKVAWSPLYATCDLRPRNSPECCCRPESFKTKYACFAIKGVTKYETQNIQGVPGSDGYDYPTQSHMVNQLFAPARRMISKDPDSGVLLQWHLAGEQWERHQCLEWDRKYCKKMQWFHPHCKTDGELLFRKVTGVKIPDTLFQCPAHYVTERDSKDCECAKTGKDEEDVILWADVLR